MDKALTCHAGGQGSNRGQDQEFFWFRNFKTVLLSSRVPCNVNSLSITMPVVTCSSMNTCHRRGKREESWKSHRDQLIASKGDLCNNPSSAISEAKHRYKCVLWDKSRGKKTALILRSRDEVRYVRTFKFVTNSPG